MDWGLALLSFMYLWAAGKHAWGWLVAAIAQLAWIGFAIAIQRYGLISMALFHIIVYGRNWRVNRKREATA